MNFSRNIPQRTLPARGALARSFQGTDGEAKSSVFRGSGGHSIELLAGDVLWNVSITFSGVHAGSEIRIYNGTSTTELAGVESCDTDHVLTLGYSGAGQSVTIRIIHPDYKIKEFTYTVPSADQSIPIQQELDRWYSNP